MEVKAPAEPRTPSMATATAERRCADVGTGKLASRAGEEAVVLVMGETSIAPVGMLGEEEEEKKEVGRAMRITPSKEMREAYCAERGKGSRRKR